MFEAEFGDIKISKIQLRELRPSPTEENEFFVKMWDAEDILHRSHIPKGTCRVVNLVKVPASCPHCQKELPMGFARFDDFREAETFEYKGATIEAMAKVDDDYYNCGDIIELRIHYEMVEYKNHVR
jgi:hypothetical protein